MSCFRTMTIAAACAALAITTVPAVAGSVAMQADVAGQGLVDIGDINVTTPAGGIRADFRLKPGFAYLDDWYDFRWINLQVEYELFPPSCGGAGQPACGLQAVDPVTGTLPAIDPQTGQAVGGALPAGVGDARPFYYNDANWAANMFGIDMIHAEGVNSKFVDFRIDAANNSIIRFHTYLVVENITQPGGDIGANQFCILGGIGWEYNNNSGAGGTTTWTQSLAAGPLNAADVNAALGNAMPAFPGGWTAITGCTLSACPSVTDCIFSPDGLAFFSPSDWTKDGVVIGETFPGGEQPLPGETLYDEAILPEEPNDWHWSCDFPWLGNQVFLLCWVINFQPEDEISVEVVCSPNFLDIDLIVDIGNDSYQLIDPFGVQPPDCCLPHPGPGCSDPECQNIVCGVAPFCCDFEWDGFCAEQAIFLCGGLCQPGAQILHQGAWSQYPLDIPPSLGFQPTGAVRQSTDGPLCPGDTNGDGSINIDDIVNVVLDFNGVGDANGDGFNGDVDGIPGVNIDDIVFVVLHFGPCLVDSNTG